MKNVVFFCATLGLACILSLAGCISNVTAQSAGAQSGASLYKRLGGYDAIAAVSDDFIGRLATDKQLSRFLVGMSADSQKRLRQPS